MNLLSLASCAAVVVCALVPGRMARAAQPVTVSNATPANPAIVPADRLSEAWWAQRHQSILHEAATHTGAEVVFIGDSTFNNYDLTQPPQENFQAIWQQFYAPRRALNLGFDGDTTSNVLWRIDHGELDGLSPRTVVLLVGSANSHSNQTAIETASGINAVVNDIAVHLPGTRIIVLGILPNGVSAEFTSRNQEVNSRLQTLFAGDHRVLYLDIGAIFYNDGGALNPALFCDNTAAGKPLQPNTLGQLRLAEAIEPAIANLLGDSQRFFSRSPDALLRRASAQR